MPQMCSTLSTSAWIGLLIRIVEGHQSFNAITLQRQVEYQDLLPLLLMMPFFSTRKLYPVK